MTRTHVSIHTPSRLSWNGLRLELDQRRAARTARRALEAELATYTTHAEVEDLLATFSDHDGPEADTVRTILLRNVAHQAATPFAA